ncbi:hypothetical protein H6G06_03955 [Anabaena sphaerica FACHB-251]|uniref:TcaA protein NTF2-like domain-containing protein n=1 Tax=Anabaena sphaerica FACHB-251 TaxID=2692883 RepID=A0A926WDQ5_9NOST|nr:hypothetical protein [Anabaena sphaerica]MBD2292659.1 hypothetical protein [Anabaena sphaerica FACHB-251]
MLGFNIQISKYICPFTVLGLLITSSTINSVNATVQAANLSVSIATTKTVEAITQQDNNVAEIRAVFDDNMRALNTENLDLAMSTIDENSPEYEETRQLTQKVFDTYDLKYEINKFEILEISDNKAKVRITQTTKKISGPAFKDNVLVSTNTLRKSNGRWKIVSTELESVNYLN